MDANGRGEAPGSGPELLRVRAESRASIRRMTSPAFNLPFRARVLHRREETVVVLLSIGNTDIGTISFEAESGRPPRSLVEEAIAEMFLGNYSVEPVEKTVEPEPEPEPEEPADGDETETGDEDAAAAGQADGDAGSDGSGEA